MKRGPYKKSEAIDWDRFQNDFEIAWRMRRVATGWGLDQIAFETGIPVSTVRNISQRAQNQISLDNYILICSWMGVHPAEYFVKGKLDEVRNRRMQNDYSLLSRMRIYPGTGHKKDRNLLGNRLQKDGTIKLV